MSSSGTSNFNATRDHIITRACYITHILGEAESLSSTQLTQYAATLNQLLMEWNSDGMPLWNLRNYTITPLVLAQASYTIGADASYSLNSQAPLKIIQAWVHDSSSNRDSPLLIIPRQQYNLLGDKTSPGTPNQMWYDVPRAIQSTTVPYGTITLFPVPDANAVSYKTIVFVGQKPFDDFDSGTDSLDLPQYWINALTWGLASQLSYEGSLPFSERAMISKKADEHKQAALSFGTEEGSLYFAAGEQYGHW